MTFILGAGASADGGCPVMKNFMKVAGELSENGKLEGFEEDYANVKRVKDKLFNSQVKTKYDCENMESLFSAIEMGLTVGRLSTLSHEEIRKARVSFLRLTAAVLERTQTFNGPQLSPPSGYKELVSFIGKYTGTYENLVDIITFNYDYGLEASMKLNGLEYESPGMDSDDTDSAMIKLHKLHGSVLWEVNSDGFIVSNEEEFRSYIEDISFGRIDHKTGPLNFIRNRMLDKGSEYMPYIIPPTDDKASLRHSMEEMWVSASQSISDADVICIVGYSIPNTDTFFRCLWAISASSEKELRKILVIDPASGSENQLKTMVGEALRGNIQKAGLQLCYAAPELDTLFKNSNFTWR